MPLLLTSKATVISALQTTKAGKEVKTDLISQVDKFVESTRTIGANGMDILQTWADASYAVHPDMRGILVAQLLLSVQNRKRTLLFP